MMKMVFVWKSVGKCVDKLLSWEWLRGDIFSSFHVKYLS